MNRIQKKTALHVRLDFLIGLFLVIIILAVYWQVRNHEFLNFDDRRYVTDIPQVQAGLTLEGVIWSFTSGTKVSNYWMPLTWLSHMLDFELFGWNPAGHHWTNLLFHILNTLLLFFVFKQMTAATWKSGMVAALFAVHPLHVESVAWIAERKDVLSTFFWLLTMLVYAHYAERPGLQRYFLVLFFFVLGLMAKPMLVTLPFVLLLMDYWPLARLQLGQTVSPDGVKTQKSSATLLIGEKIPLFVLSAVASAAAFITQRQGGALASMDLTLLQVQTANALIAYVSYIGKMIWPSRLAVFYPHSGNLPIWQAIGAGMLLMYLSVLFVRWGRKFPYLPAGWFWYLGTLVPVIGLVKIGAFAKADRYTYVPLIGLFVLTAWGVPDILTGRRYQRILLPVAAGLVLSALMVFTWFQVGHWQNSITLFRHALKVTENNWLAHTRLGHALDQQDKLDEAIVHYSEALQINPRYANAHNNLGSVLARRGDATKAMYHYYEALRTNPHYPGVYFNLGKILANQGNTEAAVLNYQKALQIDPEMTLALYQLAWLHATHQDERFRDVQEAIALAEKLCRITKYKQPQALDALAAAYAVAGRYDGAVLTAQKGLQLARLYGLKQLASGIKERLQLYQRGRPYRQTQ